jgi:hypothetical protein
LIIETPSAELRGFTTETLVPGGTSTVVLDMDLDSTKLVLPDPTNPTAGRIIQFDDISDITSQELKGSGISNIGFFDFDFKPWDLDFDDQGRIYIANNYGGSGMGRNAVIRVDDISGSGGIIFNEPEYDYGIWAVTVDRKNKYVYYAPSGALTPPYRIYRSDLDGAGEVSIDLNSGVDTVQTILGMAIDENGKLYIAGDNAAGQDRIFRVNPTPPTGNVEVTYQTNLTDPWDILVKDNQLYVANRAGADNFKIIRLNPDFSGPVGYGLDTGVADTGQGKFYGPRRFVAILNKKISIIDDREINFLDKVVSMDDITGANWQTLPISGDGQSLFTFFYNC